MRTNRILLIIPLLLLCLSRPAAAAPEQWVQVTSTHFTLYTDAGEKKADKLLDQFERMRWVFHTLFPNAAVDPGVPIVVIAAKNQASFTRFMPADRLGKGQMQIAGYFSRTEDKNYILLRLDAENEHPFTTVYHEYTHLLFASAGDWLPIWLNEGEAEFFQNTDIEGKDVRLGQPSADDILYLREHSLIPLNVLFGVDEKSPYYHDEEKGSVFYAESWALTHYLTVNDKVNQTHKVQDYFLLVSQHQDPVTAAEKAFGDVRKLQADLQSYIRDGDYKEFVLNSAAAPVDESAFKVQAVSQPQADAIRADVLVNGQRLQDAQSLLDAVLKADPNNVQAHETMGMLAYRQGNMQEAGKWFGGAVRLGSQDFLAYFFYAMISMESGGNGDDSAVETSLRTAIQLNPNFAPSYDRLAVYYGRKHQNLDEAHMLNLQAVGLDPANVGYRVNAASLLIEMERYDDAERVLKAASAVARKPIEAKMVQSLMEQVEQLRSDREQAETLASRGPGPVVMEEKVLDNKRKHPTVSAGGTRHSGEGVMHSVSCNYPTEIEFRVETAPGKTILVYNNDLSKITVTAVGFTPTGTMYPCSDFEGKKARVQYVDSPDESVDGQVTDVELRK